VSGTSLNGGADIRTAVLNDSVLRSAGDAFVEQQLNIDSPIFRASETLSFEAAGLVSPIAPGARMRPTGIPQSCSK